MIADWSTLFILYESFEFLTWPYQPQSRKYVVILHLCTLCCTSNLLSLILSIQKLSCFRNKGYFEKYTVPAKDAWSLQKITDLDSTPNDVWRGCTELNISVPGMILQDFKPEVRSTVTLNFLTKNKSIIGLVLTVFRIDQFDRAVTGKSHRLIRTTARYYPYRLKR